MIRFYLHWLLLAIPIGSLAQARPPDNGAAPASEFINTQFEHLSVDDGLSNNSVNCILQDREGFMWFGTNDGLNKYDGYTFKVLKPDPNDPGHSFQNNQIYHLCEDHANRLWVATLGGLHEVDKLTGRVTPHPIRASNADKWNYQHSVYEDSRHLLWLSTLGGLARYEPTRHRFTLFPLPQPEATIKTVFEDPQHRFWVATFQGLYLFDRSTGTYTLIPAPMKKGAAQPAFMAFYMDPQQVLWLATASDGLGLFRLDLRQQPRRLTPYNPNGKINPFTFLNSMQRDATGIVWLATTTGLQRIDLARNQVFTYHPDPNASKGISSNIAQTVYHDRAGTRWIGTDNGIDRQSINTKPFMTYQIRPNRGTANLPENNIIAFLPVPGGRFWVSNGYNVYRPSADGTRLQLLPPEILGSGGQFKNYVQAFLPDDPAGIWVGTLTGLYHVDRVTGRFDSYPSEVPIGYISRGPSGEIWVGSGTSPTYGLASFNLRTHQYRYYKYRPNDPNGPPDQYVHGLLASRTGDVWVPFRKNGLARFDPRTGRFIHYTAGPKSRLNSNDIQTIYEDDTGIIWVGTQQGGLNRFDARTGLFSAMTTRDGLPSNNIVGITNDNAGRLWLSTEKGLCRFDVRTNSIRTYQTTDGLPSNYYALNAVFRQQSQLFFGSLNGIVHFNPDSIRDDTRPFPVYITALTVLDKTRPLTDSVVTLNHDENFLSFSFAALAYAQPEQNQHAYQLVGVDKNWVQNGNRHVANYTNLSPGTYTFRVKAANSDGFWNEKGASVRVVIRPPWWATWWAYALYVLLIAGAIWRYIRFYTNRIRQQQALELNRREAEQFKAVDELKTRFFSNITHEFRTPLSLIMSPVEKLIQDDRFDEPTRRTLTMVQRNATQLLRLINQLLDLSKLEAHHMAVSLMQGAVTEFVGQIVESFRPMAEQKGVILTFTADATAPESLFDADKWEKILTNLLSNALKFTGSGGHVTVALTAGPSPGDSSPGDPSPIANGATPVRIQITDSGIGISPENLPHIFDRFYQVDTSHTRAYEGTGIGLALVWELIELVGGTISVESQPGVGTTFVVTLPAQPASPDAIVPKVALATPALIVADLPSTDQPPVSQPIDDENTPLVLIVEDNAELRGFLAAELAATYRILQAADGEEGWHLTLTELPDLVISDVMMPRMDGHELTQRIKNHPDTDHIAVVILSAKAAHGSRLEGLQRGADDYIAKPFHLDELQLRLRNLISHQQKLRDQYRQQFTQPNTPSPLNHHDDPFLHRIYKLLDDHLDDPLLNVDWLADELAMSRKTLYRKLHSLLQLNPHELIRQYRLRKAADLLRAGHSASQTAYLAGFKTPSHFAMVFKEFYQKSPSEFMADDPDSP